MYKSLPPLIKSVFVPSVCMSSNTYDLGHHYRHGTARDSGMAMTSPELSDNPDADDARPREYPLQISGRARTFVSRMPIDALQDLSDNGGSGITVFMYCWIDHERGQGGHVHFVPCDIAGDSSVHNNPAFGSHNGEFSLSLPIRDKDPDLLKLMGCMRMKDQETRNTRTVTLATSAVQLDRLLMGEEQCVTMYDQFCPSNYTEVVLKASNATEFANHASHASSMHDGGQFEGLPYINFCKSHLWSMGLCDDEINNVTNSIQEKIMKYGMQAPPGGDEFTYGQTRFEKALLFLSLCLGTPAYTLVPFLHRPPAGSSVVPSSSLAPPR